MDLQLVGKRALVTGSTAGIGAEIARTLGREGVSVVVHGRSEERAARLS
jgi:short-subunit dehydrogenase